MDARSGGPAGGGLASRTARPRRRAPRGPEPRVAARPPPRAGAPGVDGRALAAPVAVRRADGPAPRRPSLRDDSRGADGRDTGHVGHDDPPRRPDGGGRPGVPAAGPERRAGRQGPADAGRTGGRRSCAGQPAGAGAGAARPPDAGRAEAAGRTAANAPGGLRLRPSGADDRLLGWPLSPTPTPTATRRRSCAPTDGGRPRTRRPTSFPSSGRATACSTWAAARAP